MLDFDLVGGAQVFVRVDLLLQNPKSVPNHDDLRKKGVERDLFGLKRGIGRLDDQVAAPKAIRDRGLAIAGLGHKHVAEHPL